MSTRPELMAVENIPHAMQNLSWLIQAGLVTEFDDGRLFLPEVITGSKKEASLEMNAAEEEEKVPNEVKYEEPNKDLNDAIGEDEDSVAKSCETNPMPSMESTALAKTSEQPMALVVPMEIKTTLAIPLEIIDGKDSVEN
jgi:hypothetical protein